MKNKLQNQDKLPKPETVEYKEVFVINTVICYACGLVVRPTALTVSLTQADAIDLANALHVDGVKKHALLCAVPVLQIAFIPTIINDAALKSASNALAERKSNLIV